MAKKIQNQEEVMVAEAVTKTEQFFEQHGKKVLIALAALLIVFTGAYAYKYLVIEKNEKAAQELMSKAQENFSGETPNFELALNGDESGAGFLEVIAQYGSTSAANLANHYAGICYLRLGDLENAAKYLKAYDAVGGSDIAKVIDAQNIGLQGDIAVEKGEYAEAAKLFGKAVKVVDLEYPAAYYLIKQAQAYAAAGDKAESQKCYKTVTEKYPKSAEAREAEKNLGL